MKQHTYIYILLFSFLGISCGNDTKEEKAATETENLIPEVEDNDDTIDLFAEADEAGWEMDEKTEAALAAFEKHLEGIEAFSTQTNLDGLLHKHQLSLGELNRSIEAITKEKLALGERANPQEDANAYASLLQEKMTQSGLGITVEEAEALINSYNKSTQQHLTSKYNPEESHKMVTKVLAPLNRDTPGFLEENLSTYDRSANAERLQTLVKLAGTSTKEEITMVLTEHYGISVQELNLLENMPSFFDKIPSEKVAKAAVKYELSEEIQNHLANGNSSEGFSKLVLDALEKKRKTANDFISFAKIARLKFYNENPNWAQDENSVENTYIDERGNFIFLPIGDLSFADAVVTTNLGQQGEFPEGAVGIPDMSVMRFTEKHPNICNLGLNGSITLAFLDNALTDVNGPDLYVFEMGAIEPTKLEISKNGTDWIDVGKIAGGTAKVDIAPFVKTGETFNFIRLTDLDTRSGIPGADIDAVGAIGGAMLLSLDSSVLFDSGSASLRENASEAIKELSNQIKGFSKGNIMVQGHTDSDGNSKSNMILSKARAQSVANELKKYVSSSFIINSEGLGENQPIAPNDTDENKQKNRRVEILITPTSN